MFFAFWASAHAQDVRFAVLRITSHGCSGTVIETAENRTVILTCAHAFQGQAAQKLLALDVPCDPAKVPQPVKSKMRVVHVDPQLDLCLVEAACGPLPVVCPLAPAGHQPSKNVWSCGYDEMKWPATLRPATIIGTSRGGDVTVTQERPWHGRSGGGLIDLDAKVLIGVTSFYTGPPTREEIIPGYYGGYVSHAACVRFLQRLLGGGGSQPAPQSAPPGSWRIEEMRSGETNRPVTPPAGSQDSPLKESEGFQLSRPLILDQAAAPKAKPDASAWPALPSERPARPANPFNLPPANAWPGAPCPPGRQ